MTFFSRVNGLQKPRNNHISRCAKSACLGETKSRSVRYYQFSETHNVILTVRRERYPSREKADTGVVSV